MATLKAGSNSNKKEFKKRDILSQKDGDVVYRIVGANDAFTNKYEDWAVYHEIVWGYKNTDGKLRPFKSCLEVDPTTRSVKTSCPAQDRYNNLKEKFEAAKASGNQELIDRLQPLVAFGGLYSIDKNWYLNVVDLQGNIGTLKIRHKSKKALDVEINKLKAEDVDPLSDENGRFFVFTRTGSGNSTDFKVSVYQETINDPTLGKVKKDIVHVLTPELEKRVKSEGKNLHKIARKLEQKEIALIVSSSDIQTGISAPVNDLIDARNKAEWEAITNATNTETTNDAPMVVTPVAAKVAPVAPNVAPVVAKTATAVAAPVQAKTQAKAIEELPDDEFFALLGVELEGKTG